MKRTEYLQLVVKGKNLMAEINKLKKKEMAYQAKIANYALEVCDIRHGGISTNAYTLKDYCEDIGAVYKTVQNWVQVYRNVVVKLDIKEPTKDEWAKSVKVNNLLNGHREISNQISGKKGRRSCFKENVPKKMVKSLYDNYETKPFVVECNSLIKSAKHCNHLLKTRDLSIADDNSLLVLMQTLDNASDLINTYLTEKQPKRKRA